VPVALAYCTDNPERSMLTALGLNSSMKSWVNVAPLLPQRPLPLVTLEVIFQNVRLLDARDRIAQAGGATGGP
jgi:hypothetical protein